jgi:hypothetical protein
MRGELRFAEKILSGEVLIACHNHNLDKFIAEAKKQICTKLINEIESGSLDAKPDYDKVYNQCLDAVLSKLDPELTEAERYLNKDQGMTYIFSKLTTLKEAIESLRRPEKEKSCSNCKSFNKFDEEQEFFRGAMKAGICKVDTGEYFLDNDDTKVACDKWRGIEAVTCSACQIDAISENGMPTKWFTDKSGNPFCPDCIDEISD